MPHSIDQLKQAAEAKAQERQQLEQLLAHRMRALQHLNRHIDRLRLEESLLQGQIRYLHQENIQQALKDTDRSGILS